MPKVLDIPGYCESQLIRFFPKRWACERNFFFYRYNSSFQHQRILEVAYSGVYPSDTIFPAGVSVTDVTNEICWSADGNPFWLNMQRWVHCFNHRVITKALHCHALMRRMILGKIRENADVLHENMICDRWWGLAGRQSDRFRWLRAADGDFQERCHSLAAFEAAWINCSAWLEWWPSGGLLIHTTSGWRQQRVDWLQRFGWARLHSFSQDNRFSNHFAKMFTEACLEAMLSTPY